MVGSAFQPFRFSQHTLDLSSEERPLPLPTTRMLPVVTSHELMMARNPSSDHRATLVPSVEAGKITDMSEWGVP
ncbi:MULTISPECIES: hypothetical protein [unclassified Streptomyces]|uniref:hypothetical protein n=1 Tax=unclassified Streptomyces TaxID=2593676 RepID=UPI00165648E2|nr:hypothetical protein [Streptomyces sp. CB02980]MCB8900913.1 hypothetical protein [Streptomyces sp. CB02980]